MSAGVFVTGTDTGVGKTWVATALLRSLADLGRRAVGMKPVAAGLASEDGVAEDVACLAAAGNVEVAARDANPYAFAPPIAPHVAAARAGIVIDLGRIEAAYRALSSASDAVVVEGAGGVLVPLSGRDDMLDIPARLGLPVVLVVGLRLGCLNHALLSTLAIRARGLVLAGWVANRIDPTMSEPDASVASLAGRLPAPLLADFRWQEEHARFASRTCTLLGLA